MTRDELYGYLADPKRLTAETLEPIRALYESYPLLRTLRLPLPI